MKALLKRVVTGIRGKGNMRAKRRRFESGFTGRAFIKAVRVDSNNSEFQSGIGETIRTVQRTGSVNQGSRSMGFKGRNKGIQILLILFFLFLFNFKFFGLDVIGDEKTPANIKAYSYPTYKAQCDGDAVSEEEFNNIHLGLIFLFFILGSGVGVGIGYLLYKYLNKKQ